MYGVLPGQRFSSAMRFYSHSTGTLSSSRHRPEATPSASSWGDLLGIVLRRPRAADLYNDTEAKERRREQCLNLDSNLAQPVHPESTAITARPRRLIPSPPPLPGHTHRKEASFPYIYKTWLNKSYTEHKNSVFTAPNAYSAYIVQSYTYKHNTNNNPIQHRKNYTNYYY